MKNIKKIPFNPVPVQISEPYKKYTCPKGHSIFTTNDKRSPEVAELMSLDDCYWCRKLQEYKQKINEARS